MQDLKNQSSESQKEYTELYFLKFFPDFYHFLYPVCQNSTIERNLNRTTYLDTYRMEYQQDIVIKNV